MTLAKENYYATKTGTPIGSDVYLEYKLKNNDKMCIIHVHSEITVSVKLSIF